MSNSCEVFLDELELALENYKYEDVQKLIQQLNPSLFSIESAISCLVILNKRQLFKETIQVASSFLATGLDHPKIAKLYAQALKDTKQLNPALAILDKTNKNLSWSHEEKPEILGLIASTHKQRYVDEHSLNSLSNAIQTYATGWDKKKGDYRWHGINLVALIKSTEHQHSDIGTQIDANEIAEDILKEIKVQSRTQDPSATDYGTAMEASIALNDEKGALRWAGKYAHHPASSAFQLGGTIRQLLEVWDLGDDELGKQIIPVLQYELLQRKGGELSLASLKSPVESGFEAVYGEDSYTHIRWLETLIERTQSVVRIIEKGSAIPKGTGFIVKGSSLSNDWGNEPVLVTNAHVVSDMPEDNAALHPSAAQAEFTRIDSQPVANLEGKRFHSPKLDLDVWICNISPPPGSKDLPITFYDPLVPGQGEKPQRIYVIGHPKGGDLVVSMHDNELVGYESPYVWYKSPTEPGSSGAPVLSRTLDTFALHHRARDEIQANEGVLLNEIKNQIP